MNGITWIKIGGIPHSVQYHLNCVQHQATRRPEIRTDLLKFIKALADQDQKVIDHILGKHRDVSGSYYDGLKSARQSMLDYREVFKGNTDVLGEFSQALNTWVEQVTEVVA